MLNALSPCLHYDNQEKAFGFTSYCLYNPLFKANLDRKAVDFRTQMRADVANHKTWAGVDDKFKSRHSDPAPYTEPVLSLTVPYEATAQTEVE